MDRSVVYAYCVLNIYQTISSSNKIKITLEIYKKYNSVTNIIIIQQYNNLNLQQCNNIAIYQYILCNDSYS